MDTFVSIHLDRNSDTPLYIQIYKELIKLIENGNIISGERLPSIRKMASHFGVNTVTVVNAYKQLEKLGYVKSRVGSGTYVDYFPEGKKYSEEIMSSRQILELEEKLTETTDPDKNRLIKYDFGGSSISPIYFPVKDFKQVINEILDRDGGYAFEYQESAGYPPLRESIKSFMDKSNNISMPFEEIQIISGAQQGIDILAKSFLNNKDVVYVEAPTYPGAVNAFKSRGAQVIEIDLQKDGIDLDSFKNRIKETPPKLFYTMPVFQNPTGFSYNLEKKKELIALSKKHNFYIIEDDHISDLYYNHKPSLLKALDYDGRVFYIKSFSKLFLPGLRLAFLWIPQNFFDKTALAKYSSDISSSGLSQRTLDLFLKKGLWFDHVNRLRSIFYEKWEKTLQAFEKHMPESVICHYPEGGHFFWVQLPKGIYAMNLYHEALKYGVSIVPGDLFFVNPKPSQSFRLSIAQISAHNIEEGIEILARRIKHLIGYPHRAFRGPGDRPLL